MYEHILKGCNPKPLAGYLKSLGIFRLIAEQSDPAVKGWWAGEQFSIATSLSRADLNHYFCSKYTPTPIVAPWNGGSGFYFGDNMKGIEAIVSSQDERLKEYRDIIAQIKAWPEIPTLRCLGDLQELLRATSESLNPGKKRDTLKNLLMGIENSAPPDSTLNGRKISQFRLAEIEEFSKQPDGPDKLLWQKWWEAIKKAPVACNRINRSENKKKILSLCRAELPHSFLKWLDAVCAIHDRDNPSFSPILGTGGNEGRLDFSNTFMQRISELLIGKRQGQAQRLLESAMFGSVTKGLIKAKIGQYDPGRAGGFNQGGEIETKNFKINPCDFVLAMEGSLVMGGAICMRNPTDDRSRFTTPFTVNFSPVGFASSSDLEVGNYETWLPIWKNPAPYAEAEHLFNEGRATIGRKIARTGIDFTRAVSTLGVDRGLGAFERFIYLQRRGQSRVALPAGRIKVQYKPKLLLLNELDSALYPFKSYIATLKNVPAALAVVQRNIDKAIFRCAEFPDPACFNNLIRALGKLERIIATHDLTNKPSRPLMGLSPAWITLSDDGSPEVRIAASLAAIQPTGGVGPLRSYMTPVDPSKPWQWGRTKSRHWHGNGLPERLADTLQHRLMDAGRTKANCVPIESHLEVFPHDVMMFVRGDCDDAKTEELLWGYTLIDCRQKKRFKKLRRRWSNPLSEGPLSRAWCLLKLLHTPHKIRRPYSAKAAEIKIEPRITQLLAADRLTEACDIAIHRLRVSGLHPYRVRYDESIDTIRLLASLLIPTKNQRKLESLVLEEKANQNR